MNFSESVVEEAALAWLEALGYLIAHGPEIAPPNARIPVRPSWTSTKAKRFQARLDVSPVLSLTADRPSQSTALGGALRTP